MNALKYYYLICLAVLTMAGSCNAKPVIDYHYRIIESFPHGTNVFTQGFEYHQGVLYESAGLRGQSRLFTRSLNNSNPDNQQRLDDQYFAEGITLFNDKVYQLTWQSQKGFIYQQKSLKPAGTFTIKGEGWGLTNNGKHLIVSNGTSRISFLNPRDFSFSHSIDVTLNKQPLAKINELEWIDNLIYANIWQSNWIVMIDPQTGQVVAKANLTDLLPNTLRTAKTDVLNGIAYDHDQQRLLVTGKNWPRIYHIELLPTNNTKP